MWILRSAAASPFGRKVSIGAAVAGLAARIDTRVSDTRDPNDPLRGDNPLGKIPTLVLEDGTRLFDSRVILEFLDSEAGGDVLIPKGAGRFPALALQALADGIMDAALLQVYEERFRPAELRSADWVGYQSDKVARSLERLEAAPPATPERMTVGEIALACALGYLDLRFKGKWRETHPRLVAWLDAFSAKVPSFEATRAG